MGDKQHKAAPITEEQVFKVADTYYNEHQKVPTQAVIREAIGGSMSTIGPWLRQWKDQHEQSTQACSEVPDFISEAAVKMVSSWWMRIQDDINVQLNTMQQQNNIKIAKSEQDIAEYLNEIKRLETQLEVVDSEREEDQVLLQHQEEKHQSALTELTRHTTLKLDQVREEKEQVHIELSKVKAEKEGLCEQIKFYQEQIKQLNVQSERQLEQLKTQSQRAISEEDKLQSRIDILENDKTTLQSKLTMTSEKYANIQGMLDANVKQLAILKREFKAEKMRLLKAHDKAMKEQTKSVLLKKEGLSSPN